MKPKSVQRRLKVQNPHRGAKLKFSKRMKHIKAMGKIVKVCKNQDILVCNQDTKHIKKAAKRLFKKCNRSSNFTWVHGLEKPLFEGYIGICDDGEVVISSLAKTKKGCDILTGFIAGFRGYEVVKVKVVRG